MQATSHFPELAQCQIAPQRFSSDTRIWTKQFMLFGASPSRTRFGTKGRFWTCKIQTTGRILWPFLVSGPVLIISVSICKAHFLFHAHHISDALAGANSSLLPYPVSPLSFRTFPDPHLPGGTHFRFVTTSCVLPNFPYSPLQNRRIKGFDLLADSLFPNAEHHNSTDVPELEALPLPASFLLFLGDFIYADVPVYFGETLETYRRLYRRNYQSPSYRRIYERLRTCLFYLQI